MLDARKTFRPDDPLRALGIAAPAQPPLGLGLGRFAVRTRPAFFPPALCAALVGQIEAERRPSTVAHGNGDPAYRTSETCDMWPGDPFVDEANRLLNAAVPVPASHGEVLQGQRYAPGQEFRAHTDAFEPGAPDYAQHAAAGGQRLWTAMVYLNRPEAGGATCFERIGRTIQPEPGMLVLWRNLDAAGLPDADSLHAGLPVEAGVKYVVTKWYREAPTGADQWKRPPR